MEEIKGDLIKLAEDGEFDVIIHGCNCFHTMNSGIAKYIHKKYPEVYYEDVNKTLKGDASKLGTITWKKVNNYNFTVVNCYTQYNYGTDRKRYVEYGAIRSSLKELKQLVSKMDSIGIPLIGCGLAGGDWNIVKKIIKDELDGYNYKIVHYDK